MKMCPICKEVFRENVSCPTTDGGHVLPCAVPYLILFDQKSEDLLYYKLYVQDII